jgi:hypothetical protein
MLLIVFSVSLNEGFTMIGHRATSDDGARYVGFWLVRGDGWVHTAPQTFLYAAKFAPKRPGRWGKMYSVVGSLQDAADRSRTNGNAMSPSPPSLI